MKISVLVLVCLAFLLFVLVPQELLADAAPTGPFLGIFIGALVVGAVLLGVAVYHIFNAPAQGYSELEFQEEEVILELGEERSRVSCTFYFMNNATSSYSGMFYFPFLVDETHPFPDDLRVSYTVSGETKEPAFTQEGNRVFFKLTLPPQQQAILLVNYTQKNDEPKATYIITSANDWHQPVGKATFEIHHPMTWHGVSISPMPQVSAERGGEMVHTIYIEDLAPDSELEITWDLPQ